MDLAQATTYFVLCICTGTFEALLVVSENGHYRQRSATERPAAVAPYLPFETASYLRSNTDVRAMVKRQHCARDAVGELQP